LTNSEKNLASKAGSKHNVDNADKKVGTTGDKPPEAKNGLAQMAGRAIIAVKSITKNTTNPNNSRKTNDAIDEAQKERRCFVRLQGPIGKP